MTGTRRRRGRRRRWQRLCRWRRRCRERSGPARGPTSWRLWQLLLRLTWFDLVVIALRFGGFWFCYVLAKDYQDKRLNSWKEERWLKKKEESWKKRSEEDSAFYLCLFLLYPKNKK